MKTHEKKVENFYSAGLDADFRNNKIKEEETGNFLNFGYWQNKKEGYLEAAKRMVEFFINNSEIKKADRILNVCCGYGTETFAYYEKFKPELIEGIDITKLQVDYANNKAKLFGLDKKIKFYYSDACNLNFPENNFSHIFGIEGPAHFNTREKFFASAFRVLDKEGELILTDIILGKKFDKKNKIHNFLVGFAAKWWVIPKANGINEETYKEQLEKAGLKIIFIKKIGDKVFPGYANYFSKIGTFKKVKTERGFFTTMGLVIISILLGYLYKKGWIEYIYVKARK